MLFRQRRIGDGLVTRLSRKRRSHTTFTCSACQTWSSGHSWRAMLRYARSHARDHADGYAPVSSGYVPAERYALTWPQWRRRLAAAVVVLVLAVVAFAATVAVMASRASSAPATSTTAAAANPCGRLVVAVRMADRKRWTPEHGPAWTSPWTPLVRDGEPRRLPAAAGEPEEVQGR